MTDKNAKILGIIGLMLVVALTFGMVFAMQGDVNVAEAAESYFSHDADKWEEGTFTELNYGIYWYASGNPIPRKSNPVDKSKPTIIFAHGWKQNEGFKQRDLLSLWGDTNSQFTSNGYDEFEFETEYYQTLIELGYNVGHFYWSQISDDVVTCDEKIWSSNGQWGMRYFLNNGSGKKIDGNPENEPQKSVAMIFGDEIVEKLGNDYAKDIHLVGHSMGGQLSLATGEYLALRQERGEINEHLVPAQVTLIDPYMTFNSLSEGATIDHLGGKAHADDEDVYLVDLCADAMETLARHDVAIDAYATIFYRMYPLVMNKAESAKVTERLAKYCAWTYLKSLASKYAMQYGHCMAIDYYFSTLYEETIAKDNYGVEVPSIKASKEYILSLRGKAFTQSAQSEDVNPFYMHNSVYTRTDAYNEPVSADYTAYTAPPSTVDPEPVESADPEPAVENENKPNLKLIIPLAVVGGLVVVGAIVAIILIVKKRGANK